MTETDKATPQWRPKILRSEQIPAHIVTDLLANHPRSIFLHITNRDTFAYYLRRGRDGLVPLEIV